jgi:DUF4097 and DUF4098 domain-containing protein YvlB
VTRVVATAIALALTLWAGFQVLEISAGTASRDERRTYAAPRSLEIGADAGDVRIERAPGRELVVETHASGSLRVPRVESRMDDGKLVLHADCVIFENRCRVSFVVRVPAGTHVSASTDAGDIVASGLTAGAALHSDSGDLRVTGSAGPLALSTDSGDIEARDVRSQKLAAHTDSGDVGLTFASPAGRVDATTDSGDVTIALPRTADSYDVERSTDSGDEAVGVRTDPLSERRIVARTDSGAIAVVYR